jgi:hypothetical protein
VDEGFRRDRPPLTDDQRDIDVAGRDDADASKVPGRVVVVRVEREEDRPADDTDDEDEGDGQAALLCPVREGGEEEGADEGDGVGRDGEQLSFGVGVACAGLVGCLCGMLGAHLPRPLMMVGRKPPTEASVRFMHEYLGESVSDMTTKSARGEYTHMILMTYVFQSTKHLLTPFQSIPRPLSTIDSLFSLVKHNVRSSSLKYFVVSGLFGIKRNVAMASNTDGHPSIKKRMRHCSIRECLMLLTPYEMRPPNAPASAPAEMKSPTRFA